MLLINWTDFTECLEVYALLDTLRKDLSRIPLNVSIQDHNYFDQIALSNPYMQVALNLLDSDFPDENIRAFAVEVLEMKLLDEDLEDYILQLTQVHNNDAWEVDIVYSLYSTLAHLHKKIVMYAYL